VPNTENESFTAFEEEQTVVEAYTVIEEVVVRSTEPGYLREYGVIRLLKRQPKDAETVDQIADLCCRAATLLLDQRDLDRAARVIDRAAILAPKHPDLPMLRERLRIRGNSQSFPPPPPVAVPLPDPQPIFPEFYGTASLGSPRVLSHFPVDDWKVIGR
jgi:hypothetical protein